MKWILCHISANIAVFGLILSHPANTRTSTNPSKNTTTKASVLLLFVQLKYSSAVELLTVLVPEIKELLLLLHWDLKSVVPVLKERECFSNRILIVLLLALTLVDQR